MFCVAVIGQIASGKSTVLQAFAKLGVEVISTDELARQAFEDNLDKIREYFCQGVLTQTESKSPQISPPAPTIRPPAPTIRPPAPTILPSVSTIRPPAPTIRPSAPTIRPPAPTIRLPAPTIRLPALYARDPLIKQDCNEEHSQKQLKQNFILPDGSFDRKALRLYLAENNSAKIWLERLIHPLVRIRLAERVQVSGKSYVMIELPLLIDRHEYPYIKRILHIVAGISLDAQIQRIMKRDDCSYDEAKAWYNTQPSLAAYEAEADDVMVSSDLSKVNILHKNYLERAGRQFE
jgi:dephospho-CoA kinase